MTTEHVALGPWFGDPTYTRSGTTNSVRRAIALLNTFGPHDQQLTLTQLAERTGLSKSTALRLLNTLRDGGLVTRTGTTYVLGERLRELAATAVEPHGPTVSDQLREVAMPFLMDLYTLSGQTVHLAMLSGLDVVYLEKLTGHSRVRSPSQVGARCPAVCTAVGKAMLAHANHTTVQSVLRNIPRLTPYSLTTAPDILGSIARARSDGFARDHQEALLGLTCVAAPVMTDGERCVAAISVAGAVDGFDPDRLVTAVRKTAANIGRAFGASMFGTLAQHTA
ncbi:IclR family transcriptional regulator [Streptomyces sp. NPDC002205]|uniref:IclR family transcriptional regulator n=1 Tax=Streptomyces sp. NPDC002205 TaxID=3154411 RepID=UPI003324F98B